MAFWCKQIEMTMCHRALGGLNSFHLTGGFNRFFHPFRGDKQHWQPCFFNWLQKPPDVHYCQTFYIFDVPRCDVIFPAGVHQDANAQ